LSGERMDSRQQRVHYRIISDSTGLLIYTDEPDAVIEYTSRIEDTSLFPADFVIGFSYLLAHYIAPRITSGDPFDMGKRALELYILELSKAEKNNLNEEQPEEEPRSEFERMRD
jgi:hypothetical protein